MAKPAQLLLLAFWFGAAMAEVLDPMQPRGGTYAPRPFEEPTPWKEQELGVPPFPVEGGLVRLPLEATDYQYFVDTQSLAVGADRAVRYTVVVASTGHARSVFHEALRCDTGEYKTIAYGRSDTFQKVRDPVWRSNSDAVGSSSAMGRFRKEVRSTLCSESYQPLAPTEMIRRLQYAH